MPASRKAISTSSTNTRSLMRPTIFLPTQAPSRVGGVNAAPQSSTCPVSRSRRVGGDLGQVHGQGLAASVPM
jgi:hypothetical protein